MPRETPVFSPESAGEQHKQIHILIPANCASTRAIAEMSYRHVCANHVSHLRSVVGLESGRGQRLDSAGRPLEVRITDASASTLSPSSPTSATPSKSQGSNHDAEDSTVVANTSAWTAGTRVRRGSVVGPVFLFISALERGCTLT